MRIIVCCSSVWALHNWSVGSGEGKPERFMALLLFYYYFVRPSISELPPPVITVRVCRASFDETKLSCRWNSQHVQFCIWALRNFRKTSVLFAKIGILQKIQNGNPNCSVFTVPFFLVDLELFTERLDRKQPLWLYLQMDVGIDGSQAESNEGRQAERKERRQGGCQRGKNVGGSNLARASGRKEGI